MSEAIRKVKAVKDFLFNPRVIFVLYALVAVGTAFQEYHLGSKSDTATHYNNFVIFRQSFFHLLQGKDLYAQYPHEYYDLFKYSPAFALFMAAFAWIPVWLGLMVWNLMNAVVLFFSLHSLPVSEKRIGRLAAWFVLAEMITSLQNTQSNALLAGLLILAFAAMERRNIAIATLLISLTVFVKLFGLVAFSLFLLYPDKKRFVVYSIVWMTLLALAPLVVVPVHELLALYKSWWNLLSADYAGSSGISVMGWLHSWFHLDPPKSWVMVAGIILFCLPLLFIQRFREPMFRWLLLCSILIWIIIFNHKAESATYIIAVSGVALWCFSQQWNAVNLTLAIAALLFTSLSSTDLFPHVLRMQFIIPYTLKAVPCILIWIKIVYEMAFKKYSPLPALQ